MALVQVESNLFIGNVADFGSSSVLQARSVVLSIVCHGSRGFGHTGSSVGQAAFNIGEDGNSPEWFIRGIVDVLLRAYGSRVISVHDGSGGLSIGAFILSCMRAQSATQTYVQGKAWLDALVSDALLIPSALDTQGARYWN